MVGTRDRVPLGIGLSSEISAGILAGGGPARVPIRFPRYPVFKVPGASSQPRPAASFRPRRKEIYYAHPPPRSRGFPAFFPGKGTDRGRFPITTCENVFRTTFEARTHPLHKPRKRGSESGTGRGYGGLRGMRKYAVSCTVGGPAGACVAGGSLRCLRGSAARPDWDP